MAGGTQGMAVGTDVLVHGTPRAEGVAHDEGNAMVEVFADGTAGTRISPADKEMLLAHFRDQLPEAMKPLLAGESLAEILGNFTTLRQTYSDVRQEITRATPPPVSAGTGNRQAAAQMTPGWSAYFGQAGGVAKASPFQKIAMGIEARQHGEG